MKATVANWCSLTLQRQIMKQNNPLKTTVDTQVRLFNLQAKEQISVGNLISAVKYERVFSSSCESSMSHFPQIPAPTGTTTTTPPCDDHHDDY